jgi:diacylglycerol kinase (ATP)
MPRKVKLIFNPVANLGRAHNLAAPLRSILAEMGGGDWVETAYPFHAQELAHQAAEDGYDLVVAMGGDGTVHEVLNGLMKFSGEHRPVLGVIPVGSGNDFSFANGISADPATALRKVLTGTPHPVDIGKLNYGDNLETYWANAIGIGFDTLVTIHSRRVPILQGFAVYLTAVLQTILLNYAPFQVKVKVDGKEWVDNYMMLVLCNGQREGGGFFVTPDGITDDGYLDYVFVQKISRLRMLLTLPHFMKNVKPQLDYVGSGRFRKLDLSADRPLYIHADGEILTGFDSKVRNLTVEILPMALQIIG